MVVFVTVMLQDKLQEMIMLAVLWDTVQQIQKYKTVTPQDLSAEFLMSVV